MPRLLTRQQWFIAPLKARGLPDVHLGRYNYTRARPGLGAHVHPSTLEICYLVRGRQTYRVGGETCHLRGGDVFLTFPNEEHDTGVEPEEKGVLYWLQLRLPRPVKSFLGCAPGQSRALVAGLLAIRSRHFRGSPRMKADLDAAIVLLERKATPLDSACLANRLQDFVLEVIRCSRRGATRITPSSSLQPVLAHIAGHLGERLRVPDLAARAGLSVARFTERFKEETGVPPAEYVLRARIDEARRRLERGGRSITEVAYDLDFSSSQYFATAFRRLEGISPRDVLVRRPA